MGGSGSVSLMRMLPSSWLVLQSCQGPAGERDAVAKLTHVVVGGPQLLVGS